MAMASDTTDDGTLFLCTVQPPKETIPDDVSRDQQNATSSERFICRLRCARNVRPGQSFYRANSYGRKTVLSVVWVCPRTVANRGIFLEMATLNPGWKPPPSHPQATPRPPGPGVALQHGTNESTMVGDKNNEFGSLVALTTEWKRLQWPSGTLRRQKIGKVDRLCGGAKNGPRKNRGQYGDVLGLLGDFVRKGWRRRLDDEFHSVQLRLV